MPHEGTSRRAILGGALAGAAVIGFGASRGSAAARPAAGGVTTTPLRSPSGCDAVTWITGVNRSGQIVGDGLIGGTTFEPVLWSGGQISAPLAPGGLRPLEIVGISDLGQYAGTYDDADRRRTALLWADGVPQAIRMGFPHTRAAAMDSSGRVLVQARSTWPSGFEGWTYDRMFLYDQGRATPVLPPDDGPWQDIRAIALNNRGAVVATVVNPDDPSTRLPFFWQAGRATWLTDVGGGGMDVRPTSLNDRGQVAGTATSNTASGFVRRAFRWQAGTSQLSPLPPGVTSGGVWVQGTQAINMHGDVVALGYDDSGPDVPVLWSGDTVTVLPVPDDTVLTEALAINDLGDICGYYESAAIGYFSPCLWRAGRRVDLPLPAGLVSAKAMRIDDQGHVFSSVGPSSAGTTSGGGVSGGASTGSATAGSVGGGSTSSSSSSGGSASSGATTTGTTTTGGTTTGGGAIGSTTGTPGCSASWFNCVQWTVPLPSRLPRAS